MTNARPRIQRRPLHGVLLLDKPVGWSSNDALQKAKWLLRAEKAGHTGTLDPLASGLLPLCFGAATKFSQVSLDADKAYVATLQLGATTNTGDAEGEVVRQRPVTCSEDDVRVACRRFEGTISQVPPMHSALKHQGKALYEYARAGVDVARTPREVVIHRLSLQAFDAQAATAVVEVVCSKGTYVRTLAEDLGEALGCGAHLIGLRRTRSGPLDVAQSISIEALQALDEPAREARLLPADMLLADWPALELDAGEAARFLTGLRRRVVVADAPHVRVYGPAQDDRTVKDPRPLLLGSGHVRAGELIADRLLSPAEVASQAAAAVAPCAAPSAAEFAG